MKSYSTHSGRLLGPIQINRIIVKAPADVKTFLWGKNPEKPLAQFEGAGSWQPSWESGPIVIPEREYCGFQIEPKDAKVNIQTLYSSL